MSLSKYILANVVKPDDNETLQSIEIKALLAAVPDTTKVFFRTHSGKILAIRRIDWWGESKHLTLFEAVPKVER